MEKEIMENFPLKRLTLTDNSFWQKDILKDDNNEGVKRKENKEAASKKAKGTKLLMTI